MDKDAKREWVAALRSGEYKQTYNKLYDSGSYCALGLLCKVAEPLEWDEYANCLVTERGDFYNTFPNTEQCKVGLKSQDAMTVTYMNDKKHASFKQIADYIEEYL